MEQSFNFRRQRLMVGLVGMLVVMLHVAFAVYVSMAPNRIVPQGKVTDVYRHLVVLGPFFTESGINHSHFFLVRYKQGAAWSPPREFNKELFSEYVQNPWYFVNLAGISYEKQLAAKLGRAVKGSSREAVQSSPAFRELNSFLTKELLPLGIDSVHITYGLEYYDLRSGSHLPDTIFAFTYDPKYIGNAKK